MKKLCLPAHCRFFCTFLGGDLSCREFVWCEIQLCRCGQGCSWELIEAQGSSCSGWLLLALARLQCWCVRERFITLKRNKSALWHGVVKELLQFPRVVHTGMLKGFLCVTLALLSLLKRTQRLIYGHNALEEHINLKNCTYFNF